MRSSLRRAMRGAVILGACLGPVFAQEEPQDKAPAPAPVDLRGVWTGRWRYAGYQDVLDTNEVAHFYLNTNVVFRITRHSGPAFAGMDSGDGETRITGAIQKDRTVTVDVYDGDMGLRMHFFGKYVIEGGQQKLRGTVSAWHEISVSPAHPFMGTGTITLNKAP